jgi:NADP-dependent 3-hydroxy acid dehydrogenase YdfG
MPEQRIALVTGASAGIGEATARQLAEGGFTVVAAARRLDRLRALGEETGAVTLELDVTEPSSINRLVQEIGSRYGRLDVLVNNAGLAAGQDPVAEGDDRDWMAMLDTNVLGLLRVTRACLPLLRKSVNAHIVNLGSVASFEVYAGGGAYAATKHAVRAISRTLRLELSGEPIRVSEVEPGMVQTEFSMVRFKGNAERAATVYRGVKPLTGADIADCIVWVVTRPPHVNIDELVVRPIQQADMAHVHRNL